VTTPGHDTRLPPPTQAQTQARTPTRAPPEPPSEAARPGELFRTEALAEQQDRWLGTVLLVPKLSHTVYTALAAVLVFGVVGLFAFGEYTRKARLSGWLAPEQGLIKIIAPQSGVLTQVRAHEGAEVAAGAALAVLSAERRSEALGATQGEVLRQLHNRRDSLIGERERHKTLFLEQAAARQARLTVMETEARDIEKEFELQRTRVELARKSFERQRVLRSRDLVTEETLLAAEEEALDQTLALQRLERQRTTLARERLEVEAAQAESPLREQLQLAEIDRAVALLEQELAEAEAQREIVITAPQAGTVTALQVTAGGSVGPAESLMTLVPSGARLEALLYGPSRSIGFVRPGQSVLIRYAAYPYQKFGYYEGVVKNVSRATVSTGELAEWGGGAAGIAGMAASGEPVYRITVTLKSQTARAYGEPAPLQPGMTLEADVLIETRRIYEWVLDPLHSLTGRDRA
jgi:membrane fusion protein